MAHHGQGERSQTDRNYTETCSIHRWLIIIKSKTVTFFNKTSSFFHLLSIEKVKSYRMSNLVYKNVRSTFECKQSFRNSMGQLGLKSFESLLNHLHVLKVDFHISQGTTSLITWSSLVLHTPRVMSAMVTSALFLDSTPHKSTT